MMCIGLFKIFKIKNDQFYYTFYLNQNQAPQKIIDKIWQVLKLAFLLVSKYVLILIPFFSVNCWKENEAPHVDSKCQLFFFCLEEIKIESTFYAKCWSLSEVREAGGNGRFK